MSGVAFRVARWQRMHRYVLIVSVLAAIPLRAEYSVMATMVTFFIRPALAQMWNLLGVFVGLISVGQQAYIGLGAYGVRYLSDALGIHPFLSAIPAGFVAVAIPVAPLMFRLRGGYFAIGTWVVAEVCRIIIANWDAAGLGSGLGLGSGSGSGKMILSAAKIPVGTRIPAAHWLGLAIAVVSVLLVYFLLRTRLGLALTAIRDNDLAAQSLGVNVFRTKRYVYLIAAFGCGIVGGVVALNLLWIRPASVFSINWTAYAIFIVVIGGFAIIEGALLGSVIYFVLLQTLSQYGATYTLLLGVIAVIMATKAPKGIRGFVAKRWNLHLLPVRRRLVLESPPDDEATAAGSPGAAAAESA